MSVLAIVGVVALAGAVFWVWQGPDRSLRDDVATLGQRLDTLERRPAGSGGDAAGAAMGAVERRVAALEQRPAGGSGDADLKPVEDRINTLEQTARPLPDELAKLDQRLKAIEDEPAPPDLGPLEQRVAALESRKPEAGPSLNALEQRVAALEGQSPDLGPIEQRIAALEARKPTDTDTRAAVTALAARMDALGKRDDQIAARVRGDDDLSQQIAAIDQQLAAARAAAQALPDLKAQLATVTDRLAALEKSAGQVPALAAREGRLARLTAARAALDTGEPVGDVPEAPPALTKFATEKPPTEASLKLAFPAVARAAETAGEPAPDAPLGQRVIQRLQAPFTIRQGDKVVLGSSASSTVATARRALDAGDLAAAVSALAGLRGGAADAVAPWLTQARDLLAARAALSEMAAHA